MLNRKLSPYEVRRVAVDAVCDERTVRAYLRDAASVRSTSALRIVAALERLLLGPLRRREDDEWK